MYWEALVVDGVNTLTLKSPKEETHTVAVKTFWFVRGWRRSGYGYHGQLQRMHGSYR